MSALCVDSVCVRRRPTWPWATAIILLCATTAVAGPPWWNDAWPFRVRINCRPEAGDVAWVRVTLADHTTPDGHDLRLVDADGQPRSFEIIHHDPRRSTLLQFRVPPDERLATWLYYGNTQAPRVKTLNPEFEAWQTTWNEWKRDPAGRPSPPKPATWYPRRGILLRIYRKAKPEHPATLPALRKLIHAAELEGACFRDSISDGFNRFGPSENYVSVYEGYLQIDQPGEYAFCTASDDGSWVRVNDRTIVEWPGPHGWGGSERGEKHGVVRLKAGVARVQYFQEEGTGDQMAFLGWRPPDAEQFSAIPGEAWLSVRTASANEYEARDKPVLAVPEALVLNTYWVRDTDGHQATLVEFRSHGSNVAQARWSFGDGLEATGHELRHVYFRTGRPEVTLTVTDKHGNTDQATCQPRIFQVDVKTRYFRYGNAEQYAQAATGYDVQHMAADDLLLYVEFWTCLEKWPELVRAAEALLRRFPDLPEAPQVAADAARACSQPRAYDPQRAAKLYELVLDTATNRDDHLELSCQRAHILAWGLGEFALARELYDHVLTETADSSDHPMQQLRRRAVIGLGDVALLSGDYPDAERQYRKAQTLSEREIKQPEMLAKAGGYSYTLEDLLARNEFDWALVALDRWEDDAPLQKLEGFTFFWRGKITFVQQPGPLALRYLELAERVAPKATHVPEAVWLRANCLLALKRYDKALTQFQRIRVEFTESDYFVQAAEKIDTCQAALGSEDAGD
ncbi:MAG: PKD domain-containing protein [Planctomycetota bacterium]